jgi:hypothetical protein
MIMTNRKAFFLLMVLASVGAGLGYGGGLVGDRMANDGQRLDRKPKPPANVLHMSTNSGLILSLTPVVGGVKVEGTLDELQTLPHDEHYYWFYRVHTEGEVLVEEKEYKHQMIDVPAGVAPQPMTFADMIHLLPGRYFVHLGIRDMAVRHDENGNVTRKPSIRGKGNYVTVE